MDPHMQQGGYGRRDQRMGPRGDMGGGEYGMAGPMGSGVGPRMGPGAGPQMGRGGGGGGGMYDVVEQDLGDGNVYHVQFKRSARNFLLGKTCQRDLQVRIIARATSVLLYCILTLTWICIRSFIIRAAC